MAEHAGRWSLTIENTEDPTDPLKLTDNDLERIAESLKNGLISGEIIKNHGEGPKMNTLLECPKCNKFLHTLVGFIDNCTVHHDYNIGEDGLIVKTSESIECNNEIEFACNQCGYHTQNVNEFIKDIACNCEHHYSSVNEYDGLDIEVCQRCGLVLSKSPTELRS